ncbi:MAG: ABC transporter permease [Gemmatimonadetes bacterium]|nr:ABC transporter permease [Gemmatimonadota bacterium]
MSNRSDDRGAGGLAAFSEGLGIALDAMNANRVRSALTVLGVAVGVSVVVAIGALMTGLRSSVMDAFTAAGPNNFIVTRIDFSAITISFGNNRPAWVGRPEITSAEADRIASLPSVEAALYDLNNFQVEIEFEGERMSDVFASGTSSGWPAYNAGDFASGRDFTPAEVQEGRAVVVLSSGLAEQLFGQRDPMGRRIRVVNRFRGTQEPFTVIGVYELETNIFSQAFQNWAVFPWTSAVRRLRQSQFQAQILVVPNDSVSAQRAQDDAIATMRGLRGLGPSVANDFSIMASSQILDMFNQLTSVFFLVILLLASAGLLVGGVGVIGIMLISVTERTREIGVRKAVGATRREILWQFLVEASVLTASGAGVGLFLGWAMASAVARFSPLPAEIPLWAVGAALGMAVMTGMLFGLLPAYRASRLEPVAALRYE